jgi:hypothetical protein
MGYWSKKKHSRFSNMLHIARRFLHSIIASTEW